MFKKYASFSIISVCSVIAIFILVIFGYIIPAFENNFMDRKKEMIRELVNSACEVVNKFSRDEKNGKLTKQQACQLSLEQINELRYGNQMKDYFWVIDVDGMFISHPYRPDLIGKHYNDIPDPAEKKLIVEMIEIVNRSGYGYVEYMWQRLDDPSLIVPKISYIKKTESRGWLIGTGVYVYDVKEEVGKIKRDIVMVSVFITFFISIILFLFLRNYLNNEKLREIAEIETKKAKEAAESANKAKSVFLTNMSHEIRTPMNGILGFASLLASTPLEGFQKEYVEIIQHSSHHLLYLINDILDFAKIETGRMRFEKKSFDLINLIERTTGFFSPQINKKKLSLSAIYNCGANYFVSGDEIRIKQILVNLISNAIKFTQAGRIEVILEELERSDNNALIQITVKDTGIGIAEDKIDKIFESFYQVDNSFTKQYQGTGLGLAIVKGITEQLNGKIELLSVVDKGSEFKVTLPFELSESPAILSETAREEKNAAMSSNRINILLAEDDDASQKLIKYIIEKYGWEIDMASNGNEALEKLNGKKYDILLLDINMPQLNGLELLEIIKGNTGFKNYELPVIVISAYAQKDLIEQVLASGADDFITKPISEKDISDIIFKLVNSILASKR